MCAHRSELIYHFLKRLKFVTQSVCNNGGVEERGHEEMCMCMVLCIHRGWRTLLHACIMYNEAEVEVEWLDVLDQYGILADIHVTNSIM